MSCQKFIFLLLVLSSFMVQARDHLIYSIEQEVPMGYDNEELKKNYFVNIGSNQGVEKGTRLDGEMRVLYATDEASIGAMSKYYDDDNTPLFELEDFMIGDHVGISVTD